MATKSTVKKRFLINYIKHTGTHNRVQEEREMWRQRKLELQTHLEHVRSVQKRSPISRGRLLSDTLSDHEERRVQTRHRDISPIDTDTPHSSYWTRQLMKAEETDPHRWGHSGYKELYPEEFVSTDERESDNTADVKSKKSKSGKKLARSKERKRKHKHSKRKTRLSTSTTSSGNSDSEQEEIRKRRKKKRRKQK